MCHRGPASVSRAEQARLLGISPRILPFLAGELATTSVAVSSAVNRSILGRRLKRPSSARWATRSTVSPGWKTVECWLAKVALRCGVRRDEPKRSMREGRRQQQRPGEGRSGWVATDHGSEDVLKERVARARLVGMVIEVKVEGNPAFKSVSVR